MKINKIVIENIHSIYGQQEIDFDHILSHSEGVFLIVGETGSGKTTILDAITLGLFGMINRLGDVSGKIVEDLGSIVSQGESKSSVKITFSVKNNTYISLWEIRKKVRSQGFEAPKIKLFNQYGELIAEQSNVKKKNIEIIGMTPDQFNKSIILAQGEFSAFLKSKFKAKAEILEKLTSADIYSKIGSFIFEKHKSVNDQLKLIEYEQSFLDILSDEKLAEHLKNQNELNLKITQQKNYISLVLSQIDIFKNKHEESKKRNEITILLNKNKILLETFHIEKMTLLEQFDSIQNVKENYNTYIANIQVDKKLYQDKLQIEQLDCKNKSDKQKIVESLAFLGNPHDSIQSKIEALKQIEQKLINIEKQLIAFNINKEATNDKIRHTLLNSSNSTNYKLKLTDISEFLIEIDRHSTQIESDKIQIKQHDLYQQINGTSIEKLRNEIQDLRITQIQVNNFKEALKEIEVGKQKNKEINLERNHIKALLEILKIDKQKLYQTKQDKELILKQSQKIISLEKHRHHLNKGEPCPLCGALDGPLREGISIDTNYLENDLKESIAALDDQEKQVQKNESFLATLNGKFEEQENSIARNILKLNSIKNEISSFKIQYEIQESILENPTLIQNRLEKCSSLIHLIEKDAKVNEEIENIVLLKKLASTYSEINQKCTNLSVQIKNLYGGEIPINKFLNLTQRSFEEYKNQKNWITVNFDSIHKLQTENQISLHKNNEILLAFIQQNNISNIEFIGLILSRQSEISTLKIEFTKLQNEKIVLETKLEEIKKREESLTFLPNISVGLEELVIQKNQIESTIQVYSEQMGAIDIQLKLHEEKKEKWQHLKQKWEVLNETRLQLATLNALIGSADGDKFRKIAQKVTLNYLIQLSNKHLAILTDRYLFEPDLHENWLSDTDPDLKIRDFYLGDSLRSCETLSGGETFIMSLALALGLSDFSSENQKIESLFIDEGFGTLDQDSLELAVKALEKMQRFGNKMVCVITHVESLKDRIPFHLRVEKNKNGKSRIQYKILEV